MGPFEFPVARAGLVGADALDGLFAFVRGEEARGGDVAVEEVPDYRGGDYGDDADEEEEAWGIC